MILKTKKMKITSPAYEIGGGVAMLAVMFFESGMTWAFAIPAVGLLLLVLVAYLINWGERYKDSKGS